MNGNLYKKVRILQSCHNFLKSLQTILVALLSILTLVGCKNNTEKISGDRKKDSGNMTAFYNTKLKTAADSVKSDDYSYYGDSVLEGHKNLLSYYFKKYINDTCVVQLYKKGNIKNDFEGYEVLGDINNDRTADSVFVLSPLNWCEYDDGQSYYFTDRSLPRLKSNSYCCHPQNVFKIGDINEDGICELGVYYSSCASRYKSLQIYSLKDKSWRQIASSDFDILTQDPIKIKFKDLVQKISKNKLRIKNFLEGKKYWDTILMK